MTTNNQVKELSPDGFSRFFVISDVLHQIYSTNKKELKILDVGGGTEFLDQQLKRTPIKYDLTALDIIKRPKSLTIEYIRGDATKMNINDSSYDVVVSTDTLEHIPDDRKQLFVDECLRVAKEVCIIAAPFDTEGVNEAEIEVNNFNRKLFGVGQKWLEEHLKYGKPKLSLLTDTLSNTNIPYHEFGTQNITNWLLNTQINLIDAKLGLDHDSHVKINKYYNDNILAMNDSLEPTYRHVFVIYKDQTKKALLNTSRYLKTNLDNQKYAHYINQLITLLADRIRELMLESTKLNKELYSARIREEKLLIDKQDLTTIVNRNAAIIKKLDPIIRISRNKLFKAVYTRVRVNRG